MQVPKRRLSDYIMALRITAHPTLLVEGADDKTAFGYVLHHHGYSQETVRTDTADMIQGNEQIGFGNREIVEGICIAANEAGLSGKILGFVDREYREFDLDKGEDLLEGHFNQDLVFWSRGHSLENYLLDFEILEEAFRSLGWNPNFENAMAKFHSARDSILQLACAIALAARDNGLLGVIDGTVTWEQLEVIDNKIGLELNLWEKALRSKRCTRPMVAQAIESYRYWVEILQNFDTDVIRWMCHGHIGFTVAWAAFARMVFEIDQDKTMARQSVLAHKDIRRRVCVDNWAKSFSFGKVEGPRAILDMLGYILKPI